MNPFVSLAVGLGLTFVLETAVFLPLFIRERDKTFIAAFYCVNAATNVSLNLILGLSGFAARECGLDPRVQVGTAYFFGCFTVLLECAVVWAEYAVLKKIRPCRHLLPSVIGANALSAAAGSALAALFFAAV